MEVSQGTSETRASGDGPDGMLFWRGEMPGVGRGGTALELGRTKTFFAAPWLLVFRVGLLERLARDGGGYLGVATSVPDAGRGIFFGCGGFIIAIHRPASSSLDESESSCSFAFRPSPFGETDGVVVESVDTVLWCPSSPCASSLTSSFTEEVNQLSFEFLWNGSRFHDFQPVAADPRT